MAGAVEPGTSCGFFNKIPILDKYIPFYIWKSSMLKRLGFDDDEELHNWEGKGLKTIEGFRQWMQNLEEEEWGGGEGKRAI